MFHTNGGKEQKSIYDAWRWKLLSTGPVICLCVLFCFFWFLCFPAPFKVSAGMRPPSRVSLRRWNSAVLLRFTAVSSPRGVRRVLTGGWTEAAETGAARWAKKSIANKRPARVLDANIVDEIKMEKKKAKKNLQTCVLFFFAASVATYIIRKTTRLFSVIKKYPLWLIKRFKSFILSHQLLPVLFHSIIKASLWSSSCSSSQLQPQHPSVNISAEKSNPPQSGLSDNHLTLSNCPMSSFLILSTPVTPEVKLSLLWCCSRPYFLPLILSDVLSSHFVADASLPACTHFLTNVTLRLSFRLEFCKTVGYWSFPRSSPGELQLICLSRPCSNG